MFYMNMEEIRWQQRFKNFSQALSLLESAVSQYQQQGLSELEEQGLIQRFEFTHELAWNLMKDYFEYQGNTGITGSRDASREAFQKGLIINGEIWMEMIKSRNQSSHTYNEDIAKEITEKIVLDYLREFLDFKEKMQNLKQS